MTDSTAVSQKQDFLAAFRYHNYRYLWGSGLAMTTAVSMELLVIGWLVLEMTDSPAMVGLVAACRFVGMGLGPFFGVLADRFDRRRILIITRAGSSIYALALVALYYTSLLEVWHIFLLVLLGGLIRVSGFTAQQAVLPDTVEGHNLTSAVAMMMVGISATMMVGPLMGGYLYEQIGAGGVFAVIAAAYLFSCLLLFPLHLLTRERPADQESVWKSLIGGIRYITNDRALFALIVLSAVANLYVFPVVVSMMPVFAREVLHVGASDLGWLFAAEGLGGLIGALVLSSLGRFRHKGWLIIVALIVWSAFLMVFAGSRLFPVSLALLVSVGIARVLTFGVIQLLLLTWTAEEVRARVMGVRMFAVVTAPVGSIFLGFGADLWGITTAIMVSASACILTAIAVAFWAPQLHRRQ